MNTLQKSRVNSKEFTTSNQTRRKFADYTSWIVIFLLAAILQGLFYTKILAMVASRNLPIFRLTSYYLLPTDLFFVPLAIFVSMFALMDSKWQKTHTNRGVYLIVWFFICSLGIIVGIYYHNTDLFGDIREYLLRSILVWAFYFIGIRSNVSIALDRVINLSVVIASVLIFNNLLFLAGIELSFATIIDVRHIHIWAEYALLFPYSLILSHVLMRPAKPWVRIQLTILALGTFSNLWKPNVAAFLICTMLAIVISRTRKGIYDGVANYRGQIIMTIIVSILLLAGFIMVSGSDNYVSNLILKTYLKQGFAIQDITGGRSSLARIAINGWLTHPILGNGFGARLAGDVLNSGLGKYVYMSAVDPHNLALQLLFHTGIVGVVVVLAIIIGWLQRVLKADQQDNSSYRIGLIVFILTVLITSLYGQMLQSEVAGYLFWASVGLEAAMAASTL